MRNTILILLTLLTAFCEVDERTELPGMGQNKDPIAVFGPIAGAADQLSIQLLTANAGVTHLLPSFSSLYEDVLQIPGDASGLCRAIVKDCRMPESLFYHSFRMLGAPAGGFGPPLAGTEGRQYSQVVHFRDDGLESWLMLPHELQAAIQEYLNTWRQAEQVLDQFTAPIIEYISSKGIQSDNSCMDLLIEPWERRQMNDFASIELVAEADIRKLSFATRLLASAVSQLMRINPEGIPGAFESCVLETEMGELGIFGRGSDTIDASCAMIIDLGGDDHYVGRIASSSPGGPSICVVIDFAGDDTYQGDEGGPAYACLGIGMLFDLSGNDRYISEGAGLASSCYGSSILFDKRGDDFYLSSSERSQGSALLGSALLIDLAGDDEYLSAGMSQGYGGTLGVGMLLDLAGGDHYNQGHSASSFVQGTGRGRWAEASDGHSLGGGLGIFIDAAGSDNYTAGSFSQGASYFTGMGLFFDLEGDDHYNALSHSQGYAAHYSLAGFFEQGGDDQYNVTSDPDRITQVLGSGRDLSAGWFIEAAGDDTYHIGNRSGGVGDLNGLGILWDQGGQDTYIWHQNGVNAGSPSLGQTICLSKGMALGSRMGRFPGGLNLGQFRDDDQKKLVIKKTGKP